MKTQINLKMDEDLLEKLDEKANEEGRTRTNLIEQILREHLGRSYWLWVNTGEMDIGDDMVRGDENCWNGCDENSLKGHKVLIYRTSPNKHIKYLAEIIENAEKDQIPTKNGEKSGYRCKYVILESFDTPLEISEMRNYYSLKDWYPLKVSFVKMVFKIEDKYWNTLRDILITKNPSSKDSFG